MKTLALPILAICLVNLKELSPFNTFLLNNIICLAIFGRRFSMISVYIIRISTSLGAKPPYNVITFEYLLLFSHEVPSRTILMLTLNHNQGISSFQSDQPHAHLRN
ncbi:hypothetical protein K501DRAFT_272152 [Backusella circina FSU 941]|nr:hypothetical protein K501DRAFT_272152 [Backusella circina FSU 941]